MWSRLMKAIGRRTYLTHEMCAEIDRLGLKRDWFQGIVDDEGLEFGRLCLARLSKEATLFERWFPRLVEYAAAKRLKTPFPDKDALGPLDAATFRILEPRIRDCEHVPCSGNFTAAIFSAPVHVLPLVAQLWPSSYRHPVFLTPDESREWWQAYRGEEDDQDDPWWFVCQDWDAEIKPSFDSFWLPDTKAQDLRGLTPVVITCGLRWGSLAGGEQTELWGINESGKASLLQELGCSEF
jgi:hypothetical protein